jgi:hypothetical protein
MANSMGSQAGAWIARSDEDRLAGGAGGFIGEPGKVGNDTGTARRLLDLAVVAISVHQWP